MSCGCLCTVADEFDEGFLTFISCNSLKNNKGSLEMTLAIVRQPWGWLHSIWTCTCSIFRSRRKLLVLIVVTSANCGHSFYPVEPNCKFCSRSQLRCLCLSISEMQSANNYCIKFCTPCMLIFSLITQSKGKRLVSLKAASLHKIRGQLGCTGVYNSFIALHVLHKIADFVLMNTLPRRENKKDQLSVMDVDWFETFSQVI